MDFEKQHKANIENYQRQINYIYDEAIRIAAQMGITVSDSDDFEWSKYPQFTQRIEQLLSTLQSSVETVVLNGINEEWNLANEKEDKVAEKGVGKKEKLGSQYQKIYYGHNEDGLEAFKARDENGMNLSKRVWKLADQFKIDTELGISAVLQDGLKNGKSAEELQRKVKQYLNEPNRIFRRRRNKETGELELSKAAQNYHPGQGVYRSSRKNALRMTATETNMAYRTADYERVKNFDFVLGVRVVCSNNHPVADICDELAGEYPKGFKFTGWHPWCRCHTESILKSDEDMAAERKKRREALLNDEPIPQPDQSKEINKMPANFNEWLDNNQERINAAKGRGTLPYFLQDNKWAMKKQSAPDTADKIKGMPQGSKNDVQYINKDKNRPAEKRNANGQAEQNAALYNATKEEIRLRILENANKRHAGRSAEEIEAIKNKWLERDLQKYSEGQRKAFSEFEKVTGIERGVSMSYEAANNGKENPNWKPDIIDGYTVNCQCCTMAHLLRRQGFDVTAPPKDVFLEFANNGFDWMERFVEPNGEKRNYIIGYSRPQQWTKLENGLYEIYIKLSHKVSHVFLGEVSNGDVRFFDPQTGKQNAIDNFQGIRSYNVRIMRIDDCIVNPKLYSIFGEK